MSAPAPEPIEPDATAEPAAPSQVGVPNWDTLRAALPAEIRDSPYIANQKGFEDLARDAITQNRLVGFEKIARPKADSPPEDWDQFYNSMGRPAEASAYDLGDFKPPETVEWDENLASGMLEDFHKAGLSERQVQDVMKGYATRQEAVARDRTEALQQQRTEAEAALRQEWGAAFEPNKTLAGDEFVRVFGDQAEMMMNIPLPNGRLLGNEPSVVEAFFRLGQKHSEHGLIGEKSVAEPSLSPADALAKAREMEADPDMLRDITAGKKDNAHFKRWSMLMDFAHPPE